MNKYFYSRKAKKKTPEYLDTSQPWDKLPEESDQAFEAFRVFLVLGFSRDLDKVAMRIYKTSWEGNLRFVEEWHEKFEWEKRAMLWDAHQNEHHDKIKDRARKDAETRYVEALPDIQGSSA